MMSDNDIRKGFQSKLSGFEAPVPPDGWQSVERSLRAAAAARTALRRRWSAGSVAAVLILLVGSILFIQNPMEHTETMVSEAVSTSPLTGSKPSHGTEMPQASESVSEPVVRPAESERLPAARTFGKARTGKETVVRSSTPAGILAAWMKREKLKGEDGDKRMDARTLHLVVKPLEKDAEQKKEELHEEEIITIKGDEEILFAGGIFAERGEGTLLLAVNGSGGADRLSANGKFAHDSAEHGSGYRQQVYVGSH